MPLLPTTLELSRWREKPEGLAHRRWAIASLGIKRVMRLKFFRLLLILAWGSALAVAGIAFSFGQAVATGGWLESFAAHFGPRVTAIASSTGALILLYPDICVGGLFTLLFWVQAGVSMVLCLVALTLVIPGLITRDRSSHALTIYLSRPLTTVDYLLGKLGIIIAALAVLWTGPLLVSWVLAMLLSPNLDFLTYSLGPLGHALLFNAVALVVLASIALGVSASAHSSSRAVLAWLGAWLILGVIANLGHSPTWLRDMSFSYDLDQIRRSLFQPGAALVRAAAELPMLNSDLAKHLHNAGENISPHGTGQAVAGLVLLTFAGSLVFLQKLRPE